MPARSDCPHRDRIWVALYNASDAITASPRWPALPGSECWAYEVAVRVADYICASPRHAGLPYEDLLREALRIHRSLAWRTAAGRRGRMGGRYTSIDLLEECLAPAVCDRDPFDEISERAVAAALVEIGLPELRAASAAARICRDLEWEEIRAELACRCGTVPSAACLRTYFGRDMGRHGRELARRLGIDEAA